MKKILKYIFYIAIPLLLVVILSVIYVFNRVEISAVIPPRPDNVPQSAIWVGGPDGGVYVLVQKNSEDPPTIYDAEIYYSSGDISYKGKLVMNSLEKPLFAFEEVNSYSFWDGDILALQDGRNLAIFQEKFN